MIRQASFQQRLYKYVRWLYLPIGLFAGALVFMAWFPIPEQFAVWGYLFLAGFYAGILLVTVGYPSGRVAQFFRLRWLRGLGLIAFGVYLFHQAISGIGYGLILHEIPQLQSWADLAVTLLTLAVTITIARLS